MPELVVILILYDFSLSSLLFSARCCRHVGTLLSKPGAGVGKIAAGGRDIGHSGSLRTGPPAARRRGVSVALGDQEGPLGLLQGRYGRKEREAFVPQAAARSRGGPRFGRFQWNSKGLHQASQVATK